MTVKLTTSGTTFVTTATKAAAVAELLGDMEYVTSKYWDNGLGTYKDDAFQNGRVHFFSEPADGFIKIEQFDKKSLSKNEAAADKLIADSMPTTSNTLIV